MEEATQQARRHAAVLPFLQAKVTRRHTSQLYPQKWSYIVFCLLNVSKSRDLRGETYFLAHLSDRYPSSSGMTDACYCAVIPSNLLSLSCACTHITLDWIGTCDSFMTISHDTGASGHLYSG